MNRDEILKKAQNPKKKPDERELQIDATAGKLGMSVGVTICFLVMLYKIWRDLPYTDIYAISCFTYSPYWAYKWWKTRDKLCLLNALLFLVAGILLITGYILHTS